MYLHPFTIDNKSGYKCGCKIRIPAIFEIASWFKDEYAVVMLDGKFGLINKDGEFVIPNIYDELSFLFGNYYRFRNNNIKSNTWACGVIDIHNNVIITPKYKAIISKEDNYFLCYEEGTYKNEDLKYYNLHGLYSYDNLSRCTWYNKNGKEITNEEVVNQTKDYLIVQTNELLGVLDCQGNEVVASKFTALTPCFEDVFLATTKLIGQEEQNLYSVVKSNGVVVLQEQTTEYIFENGFFNILVSAKS